MKRREAMQSLGAIAAARWAEADLDPDEFDDWGGVSHQWELDLEFFGADLMLPNGHVFLENPEVEDSFLRVSSDSSGVDLDLHGDTGEIDGGALGTVSAEDARELAIALYMAAEEVDARGYQE